jgi:hypothetical protein
MGGGSSINYAVPVTQKVAGETAVYRAPDFKDTLCDGAGQLKTMKSILINSSIKFGILPALGTNHPMQELSSRIRMESPTLNTSPTRRPWIERNRSAVL